MSEIEGWLKEMKKHFEKSAEINCHNLELFEPNDTKDVEEAYALGMYKMLKLCISFFDENTMKFNPLEAWYDLG